MGCKTGRMKHRIGWNLLEFYASRSPTNLGDLVSWTVLLQIRLADELWIINMIETPFDIRLGPDKPEAFVMSLGSRPICPHWTTFEADTFS